MKREGKSGKRVTVEETMRTRLEQKCRRSERIEDRLFVEECIDAEEESQLISDVKADLILTEDEEYWLKEHDAEFFDAFENSLLNRQGHIFYPEDVEQNVVRLISSDGLLSFWGLRVGNWVANDGYAMKFDPRGTGDAISLKRLLETNQINPDWRTWDNETIEFVRTQLPE